MLGVPGLAGSLALPLQVVEPAAVAGVAGPVRGVVAFGLVLLVGAGLRWRHAPFVDRAIDASMSRPVVSLGYGLAAHAVIAFASVYLTAQLARAGGLGPTALDVGAVIGGAALLAVAGLGFTVLGSVLAGLGGRESDRWGAVVGAAVAGVVAALDPVLGGLAWFVVVSTGIGGPTREWLHASAGPPGVGGQE